jgi:hypothetical protein
MHRCWLVIDPLSANLYCGGGAVANDKVDSMKSQDLQSPRKNTVECLMQ